MKRLKFPKLGTPKGRPGWDGPPPEAGRHRDPTGQRRVRSAQGRHRARKPSVPPHSEDGSYSGRHRRGNPPPSGRRRQGEERYSTPQRFLPQGRRQTPADDRDPLYFRRR